MIEVERWRNEHSSDKIYLFEYENHCFVILYIHSQATGYIADGANTFITDQRARGEISQLLRIKLIPVVYERPLQVDFCGSSAVLITIDLNRYYKRGKLPDSINAPRSLKKRITNLLHKHSSAAIEQKELKDFVSWIKCPHCNRNFRSDKRNRLNQHIRFCS